MRSEPNVAGSHRACQALIFLIALRSISTLTRGSPLKRSSYSGGVESVEVFARYRYRAASDAPTERGW